MWRGVMKITFTRIVLFAINFSLLFFVVILFTFLCCCCLRFLLTIVPNKNYFFSFFIVIPFYWQNKQSFIKYWDVSVDSHQCVLGTIQYCVIMVCWTLFNLWSNLQNTTSQSRTDTDTKQNIDTEGVRKKDKFSEKKHTTKTKNG